MKGTNIFEGTNGAIAPYARYRHFGVPAQAIAEAREKDAILKRWKRKAKALAKRKAETKGLRDAIKAKDKQVLDRNAVYWAMVKLYLNKGLSLSQAKEKTHKRGLKI